MSAAAPPPPPPPPRGKYEPKKFDYDELSPRSRERYDQAYRVALHRGRGHYKENVVRVGKDEYITIPNDQEKYNAVVQVLSQRPAQLTTVRETEIEGPGNYRKITGREHKKTTGRDDQGREVEGVTGYLGATAVNRHARRAARDNNFRHQTFAAENETWQEIDHVNPNQLYISDDGNFMFMQAHKGRRSQKVQSSFYKTLTGMSSKVSSKASSETPANYLAFPRNPNDMMYGRILPAADNDGISYLTYQLNNRYSAYYNTNIDGWQTSNYGGQQVDRTLDHDGDILTETRRDPTLRVMNMEVDPEEEPEERQERELRERAAQSSITELGIPTRYDTAQPQPLMWSSNPFSSHPRPDTPMPSPGPQNNGKGPGRKKRKDMDD